ncbi:MAG: RsmB/NOP family class I SAM-dependent RNA methyltransferase [Alphaproteobacteria bacterium]
MRFGGRLQAAIEVLSEVEGRRRPVAAALKDWGVAHRFAGSGDRAAIGNLVYDALRWRLSSAWAVDSDRPVAIVLAMVRQRWGIAEAALSQIIRDDPHAPEPLSDSESAALAARDVATAPDHVRADVPEWLAPSLERAFGPDWVAEGEAAATRPPLDLRVNRLKADRDKVRKALARLNPQDAPFAPDGLRIPPTTGEGRHPNVTVEAAYRKGWFEVQDEGSQLAAAMTQARKGEQILDLAAGAGGKTLALAAAMDNGGQIFATDADRHRLAPIYERLKRAGTRNVQVRAAGRALDDLQGRLSAVLVDAPCTGTGTWRRRPDTKWRLRPESLQNRMNEQIAILDSAAPLVPVGGRLVYVTCSCLPRENDDQIRAFLDRQPGFATRPGTAIAATVGLDAAGARMSDMGALLSPGRTGTDTFFVAVMERGAT